MPNNNQLQKNPAQNQPGNISSTEKFVKDSLNNIKLYYLNNKFKTLSNYVKRVNGHLPAVEEDSNKIDLKTPAIVIDRDKQAYYIENTHPIKCTKKVNIRKIVTDELYKQFTNEERPSLVEVVIKIAGKGKTDKKLILLEKEQHENLLITTLFSMGLPGQLKARMSEPTPDEFEKAIRHFTRDHNDSQIVNLKSPNERKSHATKLRKKLRKPVNPSFFNPSKDLYIPLWDGESRYALLHYSSSGWTLYYSSNDDAVNKWKKDAENFINQILETRECTLVFKAKVFKANENNKPTDDTNNIIITETTENNDEKKYEITYTKDNSVIIEPLLQKTESLLRQNPPPSETEKDICDKMVLYRNKTNLHSAGYLLITKDNTLIISRVSKNEDGSYNVSKIDISKLDQYSGNEKNKEAFWQAATKFAKNKKNNNNGIIILKKALSAYEISLRQKENETCASILNEIRAKGGKTYTETPKITTKKIQHSGAYAFEIIRNIRKMNENPFNPFNSHNSLSDSDILKYLYESEKKRKQASKQQGNNNNLNNNQGTQNQNPTGQQNNNPGNDNNPNNNQDTQNQESGPENPTDQQNNTSGNDNPDNLWNLYTYTLPMMQALSMQAQALRALEESQNNDQNNAVVLTQLLNFDSDEKGLTNQINRIIQEIKAYKQEIKAYKTERPDNTPTDFLICCEANSRLIYFRITSNQGAEYYYCYPKEVSGTNSETNDEVLNDSKKEIVMDALKKQKVLAHDDQLNKKSLPTDDNAPHAVQIMQTATDWIDKYVENLLGNSEASNSSPSENQKNLAKNMTQGLIQTAEAKFEIDNDTKTNKTSTYTQKADDQKYIVEKRDGNELFVKLDPSSNTNNNDADELSNLVLIAATRLLDQERLTNPDYNITQLSVRLTYLGKYTAEEIAEHFYRLGVKEVRDLNGNVIKNKLKETPQLQQQQQQQQDNHNQNALGAKSISRQENTIQHVINVVRNGAASVVPSTVKDIAKYATTKVYNGAASVVPSSVATYTRSLFFKAQPHNPNNPQNQSQEQLHNTQNHP